MHLILRARAAWQFLCRHVGGRLADQRGEGVISTAIAVLIMALIGAAMWALFQTVFTDAGERIQTNVEQIQ
ncbi:MAG: hypothetical protein ACR2K0_02195 [Acidimicrobiales bacterium]|jgi:nitrate/nitrite transporter NarK